MENLYEKTLSKEQIYSGKIIDLYVEEVELPNKKTGKRDCKTPWCCGCACCYE